MTRKTHPPLRAAIISETTWTGLQKIAKSVFGKDLQGGRKLADGTYLIEMPSEVYAQVQAHDPWDIDNALMRIVKGEPL